MTTWFLVVIFITYNRVAITSMEFNSKQACEKAGLEIVRAVDKISVNSIVTQCLINREPGDDY